MTVQSWRNWSGGVTALPRERAQPTTEDALRSLVVRAGRAEEVVRVVGAGHSFTPLCATDGVLVSLDDLQGIRTIARAGDVTVWAGTRIAQLGASLLQAGLALDNQGDIDSQSIAGAISTGTHGTGPMFGSLATQVTGLRLVLASGDLINCSATEEPDLFSSARVSLGALGVLSQVTLRAVPAFRLRETSWVTAVDECLAELPSLAARNRHVEFFWLPVHDRCVIKALRVTDEAPRGAAPMTLPPPGTVERYLQPERVDWSARIYPSVRAVPFNEMEFAVPAASGPECFLEIRQCMRTWHPGVEWAVEYRTQRADTIDLSTAYDRDLVAISIHEAAGRPYEGFFRDAEAVFRNYRGRPHWGKIHWHTPRELRALYPMWNKFQVTRERLDPTRRFLNSYLRTLFLD
jgi:FAD/FMN-containing dehydrogenase